MQTFVIIPCHCHKIFQVLNNILKSQYQVIPKPNLSRGLQISKVTTAISTFAYRSAQKFVVHLVQQEWTEPMVPPNKVQPNIKISKNRRKSIDRRTD